MIVRKIKENNDQYLSTFVHNIAGHCENCGTNYPTEHKIEIQVLTKEPITVVAEHEYLEIIATTQGAEKIRITSQYPDSIEFIDNQYIKDDSKVKLVELKSSTDELIAYNRSGCSLNINHDLLSGIQSTCDCSGEDEYDQYQIEYPRIHFGVYNEKIVSGYSKRNYEGTSTDNISLSIADFSMLAHIVTKNHGDIHKRYSPLICKEDGIYLDMFCKDVHG